MRAFFVDIRFHIFILLILLVSAVFVGLYKGNKNVFDAIERLRFTAFDYYNKKHPRQKLKDNPAFMTEKVIMVDIDEASLEKIGQWAWPRTVIATMIERLNDAGVKAIAFDMVFAEPDRTSAQEYIAKLPEKYATEALIKEMEKIPSNDEVLSEAIKTAGNVVTGFTIAQNEVTRTRDPKHFSSSFRGEAKRIKDRRPYVDVTMNIPVITLNAAGNGSFVSEPEADGLIRKLPAIINVSSHNETKSAKQYFGLAIETLRASQKKSIYPIVEAVTDKDASLLAPPFRIRIGDYKLPIDEDGKMYIYWSDPNERKKDYLPAWKLLEGVASTERLKDSIVVIGTSAEGLRDIRSTPVGLFVPGVEAHINVLEQMISGEFLSRPLIFKLIEGLLLLLIGLVIIFTTPYVGAVFLAVIISIVVGSICTVSYFAFLNHGLLLDPVYPSLSIIMLFVLATILAYIRTESERKQIREAFGLYISPEYMEELTSNPGKLALGGQTKNLTVMFTDIRSFTSISEKLTPEELIHLMNDFLTPMSDLVMVNRGTIDKYMGDAMMAFWNAPLDDPQHAKNACRAALKMNEALVPINENLAKMSAEKGTEPLVLKAGIGINTGSASVGNMGSKQRFAYSALGDNVNLASRLEGQTKAYGVETLIGEGTYIKAQEFACLELDLIKVKGKNEPERIYALVGDEDMAQSDEFSKWATSHNKMLEAYRSQDFKAALKLNELCLTQNSGNISDFYHMFKQRINDLIASPPPSDWDGVYVATSK